MRLRGWVILYRTPAPHLSHAKCEMDMCYPKMSRLGLGKNRLLRMSVQSCEAEAERERVWAQFKERSYSAPISLQKAVCYVERQISYVTGFEKRKATVSICKKRKHKHTHTTRLQCVFVVLEETSVIDNINHIELK